jgi:hypothetical protein
MFCGLSTVLGADNTIVSVSDKTSILTELILEGDYFSG